MKRFLILFSIAVMVLAVWNAPITTQAQEGDDDPLAYFGDLAPEEGATLRVSGWGEESEQTVVRESIARFNELFPDVEVIYEPIPNEFGTTIKAGLTGGTAPDVFYVDSDIFINTAANGQLLALNDYMDMAGVTAEDYPAALLSQWVDSEGMVYGIPKDFNSLALFYLPSVFDEADIDYPSADWTWADFREAAEAIGEATEVAGICTPADVGRIPAFMLANGGGVMNEDYTEPVFNSPESTAAVEFWYGLYADEVGANPTDIGAGWCGEAFGNEMVGMAVEGGWLIPYMDSNFAEVEWSAAPLPMTEDGGQGNLLFQNAWGAKAETEYPQAAALLVLYMTSPMNQAPIAESGFALPTHSDLLNDEEFLSSLPEAAQIILAGATTGQAFYYGEHNGEIQSALAAAFGKIWAGEAEPQAALDEAATTVTELVGAEAETE